MVDLDWGKMYDESADAFEVLPKDTYRCQVVKAEATTSSNDKLMFKITLEVIAGPKTGSTLWNNIVLTPDNKKAVFFFFQNLESLGVTQAFLKQQPKPNSDQVAAKMVGAVVDCTVDHSEYQGRKRANVTAMKQAVGGGSAPGPSPAGPSPAAAPAPQPSSGAPAPTF